MYSPMVFSLHTGWPNYIIIAMNEYNIIDTYNILDKFSICFTIWWPCIISRTIFYLIHFQINIRQSYACITIITLSILEIYSLGENKIDKNCSMRSRWTMLNSFYGHGSRYFYIQSDQCLVVKIIEKILETYVIPTNFLTRIFYHSVYSYII